MSIYGLAKAMIPSGIRSAIKSLQPTPTYNQLHAKNAALMVDIKRARVLVVGANTGKDCRQFIKRGAKEVHGLDVIDNVGADFRHPRTVYHRQSIEKTDLPSGSFDLVYSVATMEHVPDVAAGYAEFARLVKPGGAIYSIASPLWYSPFGNHMACFAAHPWIHIVFNEQQIIDYAREHAVDGLPGVEINDTIAYMMNPAFFNMRKASEYAAATRALDLQVECDDLINEDESLLLHPLGRSALALGFTKEELLPVTHRFIARAR